MSAVAPRGAARPLERSVACIAGPRAARVRWSVSRTALARLDGAPARRADDEPELEITVSHGDGQDPAVRAVLKWRGGEREVPLPRGAASVTVVDDGAMVHWRAVVGAGESATDVLDATLDAGGVRYARTCLLAGLGLAGGRYEIVRGDAGRK